MHTEDAILFIHPIKKEHESVWNSEEDKNDHWLSKRQDGYSTEVASL